MLLIPLCEGLIARGHTVSSFMQMFSLNPESSSLPELTQLSGQKEDGLLSNVSPGTQFRFPVLFQSHVPAPLLVLLRQIGVVVVLLQLLQEETFVRQSGLKRETEKENRQLRALHMFEVKSLKKRSAV